MLNEGQVRSYFNFSIQFYFSFTAGQSLILPGIINHQTQVAG